MLGGARKTLRSPAQGAGGTEASPQPRVTEGSIGFGRVEAERAALGDRREAGTFYRTSGMSWKSALESSVPMESAMKNVRTRRKKAFWVHGTMKSPSREATLIIDTLRKPKPQTAEREETRARHYRGSRRGGTGRVRSPPVRAGGKGSRQLYVPALGPASRHPSISPFAPAASTATQTIGCGAGRGGNGSTQQPALPPSHSEKVFPKPAPALRSGKNERRARGGQSKTLGIAGTRTRGSSFSTRRRLEAAGQGLV